MGLMNVLARISGVELTPEAPSAQRLTTSPDRSTALVPVKPSLPDVVRPKSRRAERWPLDMPLVWLSKKDPYTLASAFAGTHVLGSNGSGKTSGSRTFAKAFLKAGFGGCILSAKPDDRAMWEELARATGRAHQLVIIAPDQKWRFNFIAYDLHRGGADLGRRIDNVVETFKNALAQLGTVYGGEAQSWISAAEALLKRAVTVLAAAQDTFTVRELAEFIAQAPQTLDEVKTAEFEASAFSATLRKARATNDARFRWGDFEATHTYWLRDYPRLPPATRESARFTLDYLLSDLASGPFTDLFGTSCNIIPEDSFEGVLLLVDLPSSVSRSNVVAQMIFKLIWQQAALRRAETNADGARPIFLWCDESHLTVTPFDATFQSLCRARRVAYVALTQNLNSYYHRLPAPKSEATAKALIGLFQTQIFHAQADVDTIEHAVKLFGQEVVRRYSDAEGTSTSAGDNWGQGAERGKATRQGGQSREKGSTQTLTAQDTLEDRLKREQLTALKNGGARNGYRVGAYVFSSGQTWRRTGTTLLYTEFDQRQ